MATNTAASFTNHTGNGTAGPFNISFSYLSEAEVNVTVGGVLKTITTHYTFTSATQITFTSGNEPANGVAIKFQRDTNISAKKVDFADGSVLTEADLDANSDQVLFAQQEIIDKLGTIEEGATGDQTAAEIRTLVESASDSNVFTDADHSKLNAIEANATQDQTASEIKSLIAGSPLDASHLAANSVDSSELVDGSVDTSHLSADCVTNAKIADDSIDSEHYVDGSIDTQHIADLQITEAKIANNTVTNSKLGANSVSRIKIQDNAIIESKILNNNITTSKIADDAVTNAKIADSAVGADQLASNSVKASKITDGHITTSKIGNDAVTTAKIADAELKTLAGMQSGTASKLADSTALTSDIADLNQLDGMAKQTIITDDDTKFPTSGAVVDYVAAQIAPIGGLEVIANEDSFPTTQPASGVVISISDIEGLIVNGSGVASNARTSGNGSDNVTINGFPSSLQSKTMAAGLGLMVSSTGSSQTYTYHKLLAKEADVEQLSNDINDFAARYRVGSSNPTSELDAGDLFFNTSTQKLLVYNATNSAWEEAQSIGNFFISTLSPAFNGSTQDFTITNAPANAQQILLSINGVVQKPNSGTSTPSEGFALSGNTVKLAAAPPTGSDYFAIVLGSTVNIGTPSNNTVTTDILQNQSVTAAKIATLSGDLKFDDSGRARFGTGNDLDIYHNSAASIIENHNLALNIYSGTDIQLRTQLGSGMEYYAIFREHGNNEFYFDHSKKLETTSTGIKATGRIEATSNMLINDNNSSLFFGSGFSYGGNAGIGIASSDNFHCTGSLAGDLVIAAKVQENIVIGTNTGGFPTTRLKIASDGNIQMPDNSKLQIGAGQDLELYHDGSNSYIDNTGTGDFFIRGNNVNSVLIQPKQGENSIIANSNGDVELYYDNVKKFETTSTGSTIQGVIRADTSITGTPHLFSFGRGGQATSALSLYGAESAIEIVSNDDGTHGGSLLIRTVADGAGFVYNPTDNALELKLFSTTADNFGLHGAGSNVTMDTQLRVVKDGAVELYHDGTKRFETISNGNKITGLLQIDRGSAVDEALSINTTGTTGATRITIKESGVAKGELAYSHGNDQVELIGKTGNGAAIIVNQNQTALHINSDGYVTKPKNPVFHAFGGPSNVASNTDIVFGQERFDVGGGYNTSNGIYTVPRTGYYHFYGQVYRQNSSADSWWGFYLNGSQISEARMQTDHGQTGGTGKGYATLQSSVYYYCSAGDEVKMRVGTSGAIHCNNTLSYFTGNLVG